MALIFLQSAEAPVECALEISQALKNHPELWIRMGIHSGPVNQVSDVNDRSNDMLKHNVGVKAEMGYTNAIAGKRSAAQKVLKELEQLSNRKYVSPYHLALVHTALRQKDRAFDYLENACKERSDSLVYLKIDPRIDDLRADPRFSSLLQRIGLE